MAAAQAGHLDVVEALIGAGASPRKTMWDGASPLFLAAQNGHARVLVYLLEQPGLPLDTQRRDGASPLWIAAQMGHEDCVRLLLRAGAKVDLARADGATPLFKACHKVQDRLFMRWSFLILNRAVILNSQIHIYLPVNRSFSAQPLVFLGPTRLNLCQLLFSTSLQLSVHIHRVTSRSSGSFWSTAPAWEPSTMDPHLSMLLHYPAILRYLSFIQIGRLRICPAFTQHNLKPTSDFKEFLQLVSRLLAAGADPNLANLSGFNFQFLFSIFNFNLSNEGSPPSTSLLAPPEGPSKLSPHISLTPHFCRLLLLALTGRWYSLRFADAVPLLVLRCDSLISSADLLQGMEALARSLTPDKLSALRSGAGLGGLRRTSLEPSGALRRPSLEPSGGLRRPSGHIGHSPFASLNSSPIRRLSIHRRSSR